MALNLDGWVTPPSDFRGLYKVGDDLEKRRDREDHRKQQAAAKRSASDKYFTNYLDPKDRFTGTKADPNIHGLLADALKQAYDMSADGADDNMILASIQPLVTKVNKYEAAAKTISANKKAAIDTLKTKKGIDITRFSDEYDDEAWMTTDEGGNRVMKDLNTIDPSDNYVDKVLKNRDVFNADGVAEFVAKSQPNSWDLGVKMVGSDRRQRSTSVKFSAPEHMEPVLDKDGVFNKQFQARYDVALDEGKPMRQPVISPLTGKPVIGRDGKPEMEDIKVATETDFKAMMNDPATAAFIRQEVRKFAKQHDISPESSQAELFAKYFARDLLETSSRDKSTYKENQATVAAPAPITRITVNNNSGGTDPMNNTYKRIDDSINKDRESGFTGTRVNKLGMDAQNLILDFANKASSNEGVEYTNKDLILVKQDSGEIEVYKADGTVNATRDKDNLIGVLPVIGTNIKVQANVAGKKETVRQGEKTTPIPQKKSKGKLY